MRDRAPALELTGVRAGYADTVILESVTLSVAPGERLAVIGRNGAGKTTLLSAVVGQARLRAGKIRLHGAEIGLLPSHRRIAAGLGYVPQGRAIFPSLTVRENLLVARRPGRWTLDAVCALFPQLSARFAHRGTHLSGGEQQMLAIGRALIGNPSVLLLDEPTEGLAPVIVKLLMPVIRKFSEQDDMSLVLVEQNAHLAVDFAKRTVVMSSGAIVYDGASTALVEDRALLAQYVGVAPARGAYSGLQSTS
ncbi:MAG: ABC transporter ATP-binding protein [Betaproteobacteria bacterium RIFCSPLOWO2_12_FULL_67_28]|nr:MAG: ABC transporter ATP-binding protein [Betaproteobacteria bacterium RIFCSPLOWO2_12_FULL_67_28]